MRAKTLPIVRVEWGDIKQDPNWKPMEDAKCAQLVECISVGFLLVIDLKERKMVLASMCNELNDSDYTIIPLGVISRVTNLIQGKELPKSKWKV